MGCAKTLTGMGLDCRESVGGIKEVYILGDRSDITFPITVVNEVYAPPYADVLYIFNLFVSIVKFAFEGDHPEGILPSAPVNVPLVTNSLPNCCTLLAIL